MNFKNYRLWVVILLLIIILVGAAAYEYGWIPMTGEYVDISAGENTINEK